MRTLAATLMALACLHAPGLAAPATAPASGPSTVSAHILMAYERGNEGRAVLEGELWARRPARLRISTHFGLVAAFELVARDDSFWVGIPHGGVRLDGRKSEVRISPLDPGRLAQAIFLVAPAGRAGGDSSAAESTAVDSAGWWASGEDSLGRYRIRFDPSDRPVSLVRTRPGATGPFLQIDFERYARVDGGDYPRRIRWHDLEQGQSLDIEFTDVKLGAVIREARFRKPARERRIIPWRSWEALLQAPQE